MKTQGSIKVVRDASGHPWLIVGTSDGYEAQKIEVTERYLFDFSWQAVKHVHEAKAEVTA